MSSFVLLNFLTNNSHSKITWKSIRTISRSSRRHKRFQPSKTNAIGTVPVGVAHHYDNPIGIEGRTPIRPLVNGDPFSLYIACLRAIRSTYLLIPYASNTIPALEALTRWRISLVACVYPFLWIGQHIAKSRNCLKLAETLALVASHLLSGVILFFSIDVMHSPPWRRIRRFPISTPVTTTVVCFSPTLHILAVVFHVLYIFKTALSALLSGVSPVPTFCDKAMGFTVLFFKFPNLPSFMFKVTI